MRQPAMRIGGVLLLAGAVLAVVSFLRMAGTTAPSAAGEGSDAPRGVGDIGHAPPPTQDTWLDAQPRASNPPEAPPPGFWRDPATQAPPDAESPRRLEVVGEYGRQNVVVHDADGRVHELTGFTQPQHVYDAAISPDGTLAYVWHMAFSPRQISVYDPATRELLHRFEPGSGGGLGWAKHDPVLVLTVSGMGMGGARATVFAIDGTTIVRTDVGDCAFSPDRRWLMAIGYQQGRGRVEVVRTATGERLFEAWLPASLTPTMLEADWDEQAGPMLRITTDWELGSVEAIDLAQLVPFLERVEGG